MKINKYWKLDSYGYPTWNISPCGTATKKQYDEACIIHYGELFHPIVLTKSGVRSVNSWSVKRFYEDLCMLIIIKEGKHQLTKQYGILRYKNIYYWGCRTFKLHQLKAIKREMELFYTKRELGL